MEQEIGQEGNMRANSRSILPFLFAIFFSLASAAAFAQLGAAVGAKALAGIWEGDVGGTRLTLVLQADGAGEFNGTALKWQSTGSTLTLSMTGYPATAYLYALSGSQLTLSGGDLQQALVLVKRGTAATGGLAGNAPTAQEGGGGLEGAWEGYGEVIEFRGGGVAIYLGKQMGYSVAGSTVTLVSGGQSIPLSWQVKGNQLTLSVNGKQLQYTRRGAVGTSGNSGASAPGGIIAPELVGKWAWINVASGNSGGSMSSETITINADGTYEYYSESSRSVNTPDLSGGTANQGGDRGTWRLEGNILHVVSRSQGAHDYSFEKRNHPKTGDPMIVIDGRTYVTFWQKAPWR